MVVPLGSVFPGPRLTVGSMYNTSQLPSQLQEKQSADVFKEGSLSGCLACHGVPGMPR